MFTFVTYYFKNMKAYILNQYGLPSVLTKTEISIPEIKKNEVLIKIHAFSINPLDCKIRKGTLHSLVNKKFPKTLGLDFSGEIIKIGKNCKQFKNGDVVIGIAAVLKNKAGCYAEYIAIEEKYVFHKPSKLSFEEAAALPVAALSAWGRLRMIPDGASKKRMLIIGATGGVGSFAVQFGKILNYNITTICSNENLAFAKQLGADNVLDYTTNIEDINSKFDVIFDAWGQSDFSKTRKLLKNKAYYFSTLSNKKIILHMFLSKLLASYTISIVTVTAEKEYLNFFSRLIENNKLKIYIDKILDFDELALAHELIEKGGTKGKIVIKIQ